MHLQTDMNELQERMFHLHALISNIPGLIIYQVTHDRNGKMRFTYISDNVSQFTGRTADEIIEDSSLFYDLIMEEDRNRIYEAEQASLKTMSSFDMEIRSKNLDGEVRWIHLRSVPRQLDNGIIIWHGIHVDITDRKTAELQLKRSIERFEMIAATTHDAVWEWNVESNELWVNEMHQRLYGLTKKDPIPTEQEWEQRVHPDDKETTIKEFAEFLDSDKAVWSAEYRFLTEEKGYRNIYDRTYIVRNETGKPIHIIGSMTDITDQKKAEEQFRDLLESAPDAIIIINEWGNIVLINRQTETIFGYRKEELLEQPLEILLPVEYREKHMGNREMFFTTPGARAMGEGRELLALHKNGTKFPVEISLSPLRTEKGLLISAAIRDISERKKVQTRLEESEKKLRHVLSSMANDFYAIDLDFRIVVINQLAEKNLEQAWKKPVKIGTNILEAIPQTEKERFKQNFTKVFKGERIEYEVELGSHLPVSCVHVSISPVKDENGVITGAYVNTIDISERKKAEEKIKQSEERYKALVENAVEALVVMDVKKGKFVDVSESAASLFKMTKEELLQKGPIDLSPEFQPDGKRTSEAAKEKLDATIAGAKPAFEWTHINSKGETIECEIRLVRLPSEDQLLIRGCIIDISERKKTEAELKRSHERYELIGRATNDAIWDWDLKTNERWGNESFYKLYGLDREKDSLHGLVPFARTHPDDIDKIKTALTTAFEQKASYVTEEFRFRMPDDTYKTFLDRAFIQYDENGNAIRLIGAMQDITERKKSEEAIREFNERFEMIAATTHDAIWEWNLETNELWANEMHQSLYGLTINDPVPLIDEWISRIHPDDVHTTTTSRAKALISNQNAWISEYRFRIGDEYRHLYDRTYVVRNAEGKAIHLMGSMTDISERKKVEEKLQTLNDRYYALMNNIDGIVWEADAKTFEFRFVSKQAERLLGYPVEQWIHEPNFWPNHIFEDDRKAAVQYCVQCTAEKRSHEFEYRMVAADGKLIWLRDIVTVQEENDEAVMLRGIMVDITERKKAEAALIKGEEQYRALIEQASDAIMITDLNGQFLNVNTAFCDLFGYSKEEVLKLNISGLMDAEELRTEPVRFKELMEGRHVFSQRRMHHKNGRIILVEANVKMIDDGRLLAIARDITERMKAEEAIRTSEETKRLIMNSSLDAIITMDINGNITEWNPQAEQIFGWKNEDVIGKPLNNFIIPEKYKVRHKKGLENYLRTGKASVLNRMMEITAMHCNGKEFPVELSIVPIKQGGDIFFCGFLRDISERKKAENDLIREKKLSDSIINSMPGVFYLFDENGKYLRWNKNLEVVSGYTFEEIDSKSLLDFFEDNDKILIKKKIEQVFKKGSAHAEASLVTKDQHKIPFYFNGWKVIFEGKPCVIGVGIDISERKKAEYEILMANERFNLIAKATNDFVWDADLLANKVWRNDNYTQQLGWKVDPGKNNITEWEEHIHPEDKERVTNRLRRILEETKKNIWTEEYRFQKADGSFITVYDRGYIMRDENAKAYRIIGAMTDISAIKKTEELLKKSYSDIRRLASHLEKVREEERIEIAREIHDELGQQLTVLKMDISWLNKNLSLKDEKQVQRMTDLMHTIDLTIKNVRKISSQLRPSVLDDLGLVSAIEWLLRDFEKSVGFKTRFISEVGDLNLDATINTALFRVVQESLTNVTRHAQATEVLTQLKYDGYELIITLMDNGKGFIINSIENKKTLGILGMRERIAKINGTFSINSTPGKGTTIEIRVPVSSKTEPKTLR